MSNKKTRSLLETQFRQREQTLNVFSHPILPSSRVWTPVRLSSCATQAVYQARLVMKTSKRSSLQTTRRTLNQSLARAHGVGEKGTTAQISAPEQIRRMKKKSQVPLACFLRSLLAQTMKLRVCGYPNCASRSLISRSTKKRARLQEFMDRDISTVVQRNAG